MLPGKSGYSSPPIVKEDVSMSRKSIPQKEVKALCALSGGVCAFPACGRSLVEPDTEEDDAAVQILSKIVIAFD